MIIVLLQSRQHFQFLFVLLWSFIVLRNSSIMSLCCFAFAFISCPPRVRESKTDFISLLFNSWQNRKKMLTDLKQNLFLSAPQAPHPRAAPQHLVLPIPQQPLTTWDPALYTASLPNFTGSIALHAVNLLATSLCPPWLTRPPQPPHLLHLSLATQLGAPTPHRFFPPSCTPHLL